MAGLTVHVGWEGSKYETAIAQEKHTVKKIAVLEFDEALILLYA
jgi:hypothetical protein